MMNSFQFPLSLTKRFSQTLVVATLSAMGVLSGITPGLINTSHLSLNTVVYAQTDAQLTQYAQAVLQIEQRRRRDYEEAKRIMGGDVPKDVCSQKNIPGQVQDICKQFFEDSAKIITSNGLTIAQFNDITTRQQNDPALQKQIQDKLLQLQKP